MCSSFNCDHFIHTYYYNLPILFVPRIVFKHRAILPTLPARFWHYCRKDYYCFVSIALMYLLCSSVLLFVTCSINTPCFGSFLQDLLCIYMKLYRYQKPTNVSRLYVICLHIISIIAGGLLGNVMMMGKELKTKSIEEETTTCTGTMTGWSRHNLCCVNTS